MRSLFPHRRAISLLLLSFLGLAWLPGPSGGADDSPHHHPTLPAPEIPGHHQHPAAEDATAEVGLEEKLGEYIPLDLVFRDESGAEVILGDLIRTATIIAPIYYGCPNVCNFLQGALARSLPQMPLKPGESYNVLSISFDETETPAMARGSKKTYLTAMQAEFPEEAWRFLTGDRENIRRLTDAVGFRFTRQGRDFLHPVVVVAPDGKIVRYLHGTHHLPMDLTLALVEGSHGRVGATIRRVASFCFTYDQESRRYVFNLLRVSGFAVLLTLGGFLAFLLLGGKKKKS